MIEREHRFYYGSTILRLSVSDGAQTVEYSTTFNPCIIFLFYKLRVVHLQAPSLTRSSRRPGVATTTSTPLRRALAWGGLGTPGAQSNSSALYFTIKLKLCDKIWPGYFGRCSLEIQARVSKPRLHTSMDKERLPLSGPKAQPKVRTPEPTNLAAHST